jgi:predicted PurR-regulated permease PerM
MARLPLELTSMRANAGGRLPEKVASRSTEPLTAESEDTVAVDAKGIALTLVAVAAAIALARYMQEVLIPFVLAGLVFYALDPLVSLLQRLRVPRLIGAGFALTLVVAATGATVYGLRDEALEVVEELPSAARKLQALWARDDRTEEPSAIEKVQDAARELEETAAAASSGTPPPRGVDRVQIEEPLFRASAYLRWGSIGMLTMLGQAALILLLTYFLLVNDELLKRKLIESIGPTLSRKKLTVGILNDIGAQVERFLLVQIFVSAVVAVATALTLEWMGLRHAWIWGLAAGLFNTIPYLGPLIVTAGLGVVGFVQFESISAAAWVAGVAFVITTVEGYWLTPALMGKVAQINRVAIFAGLLFWSWLWGIPGMLLAVPMMMVAKAVCDRVEELQPIGTMLGD